MGEVEDRMSSYHWAIFKPSGAKALARHLKWRDNRFLWRESEFYMEKPVFEKEFDILLRAIQRHPDGLGLEKLLQLPRLKLSRRTLQRRLAYLVATNQLQMVESGKNVRYCIAVVPKEIHKKSDMSLSVEGNDIKHYLQQPIHSRKTVHYHRKFLDQYRPNETTYLPIDIRKHLQKSGASLQHVRPAGTYAREILSRLLIDLSWNSSRLEGNTYSLLDTERLLSVGETADGKTSFETQMILNHKNAIEFLVDSANEVAFNRYTILNLHALLSDNLLSNPEACGRLRTISVAIHGTTLHPLALPQLIDECFQEILNKASAIHDPYEQAFFVMVHLPYLQPFEDVNKRVSRLAANIPLIKHNLCPLSFIDVSEQAYIDGVLGVYELNRIELLRDLFVWAYERSALRYSTIQHSLGEPDPFRLLYRAQIMEIVSLVVKKPMNKKAAAAFIQQQAALHIPQQERARYVEIVEIELLGLHAGNIARYRLRPTEFEVWYKNWR